MNQRRTVYNKILFPSFLVALLLTTSFIQQAAAFGTIELNFAGQSRTGAVADKRTLTPDMSGDVGLNEYIQAVNLNISLYDKFVGGAPLYTTDFDTFFDATVLNGSLDGIAACDGFNQGQPQVFFDHMAGRWLITDVAYDDIDNGPYYQCIAVSRQPLDPLVDPFAAANLPTYWSQWAIEIHPTYLHDLPKFGVWPDGYYMATDLYDVWNNGLHRTPKGVAVWVFNRNDMVAGNPTPATQDFYISESFGYSGLLPSNLLGDPPPNGTPNYFAAVAPPNKFYTWEFHVDWINTSNSSFSGPKTSFVNNFTWPVGHLARQLGSNEQLDIQGQRLMQPLQYRYKVNGAVAPALWANHTVGNGSTVGVRWYELRNMGGPAPSIYQQGTYIDPSDNAHRWLGSLAVDGQGNMALAYSKSNSTMYPAIYQTGRLATDPIGQLQPEMLFWQGTGPQDHNNVDHPETAVDGPWGSYSHMTVDPYDDCNFWYTNEYYDVGDTETWQTRIFKFSLVECDPLNQGVINRVSLHTNNSQGFHGGSGIYGLDLSANGRYVVFESEADTLVDGDNAGHVDVFLRDRDADNDGIYDEPGAVTTTRISKGVGGVEANGDSGVGVTGSFGGNSLSISADGRYIAFSSEASNLVANDTNGTVDVFVYDRVGGTTQRVSVASGGGQAGAVSDQPSISADGRYIAFRSFATNLIGAGNDTNNRSDIFVHDRIGNVTTRVSVATGNIQSDGHSFTPQISDSVDGRYVVFASDATNLVAADGNGFTDVFLHDRVTGVTTRVSIDTGGLDANGRSYNPSVSANGTAVVFASDASDLVAGDVNGKSDIFLYSGGLTTLVDTDEFGNPSNGHSYRPAISHDGTHVAFETEAGNLLPGDVNGLRDIYVKVLATDEVRRVTFGYVGDESNGPSFWPAINSDGRHTAYASDANNLVNKDTNNLRDVFAHDRDSVPPPGPMLYILEELDGSRITVLAGDFVDVPIGFANNGHNISSVAFTIDLNNPCFDFDPTDSNSDGVPDAVTFNLPAGYAYSAAYDAADLALQLSAYDPTNPLLALPNFDGTGDTGLVTVEFRAICQPPVGGSQFVNVFFDNSPIATFGNTSGESVPGTTKTGAIEILYNGAGDCNDDGVVDAGDISALILEIFDGDGSLATNTGGGSFAGTHHCDANDDTVVDAGDISCTILIIFEGFDGLLTCGTGSTLLANPAFGPNGTVTLTMPNLKASPGDTVTMPVLFDPDGNSINSVAFSVDLDQTLLAFDANDGDGDGVPDGVQLNLPAGFSASVSYDETDGDGELDVVVFNFSANSAGLTAGELLSLSLTAAGNVETAVADVTFSQQPNASFGGTNGSSVPGTVTGGSVQIGTAFYQVYLPMIVK